MFLSKNLQVLRKKEGFTQEELADQLGVSRQSVSKWETGESYPETDKLLLLCDIFHVSLDELMRTDLESKEMDSKKEEGNPKEYIRCINHFSVGISLGVFLILFGVSCCVALCGYAETLTENISNLFSVLGGVIVIIFVAIAVFLFVFFGISYDHFCNEHEEMKEVYGEEEIKKFNKRFMVSMPCLVSGIILDVAFLIVMISLIDYDIVSVHSKDVAYCFIVSVFLFLLSLIVGGLVYMGIQRKKYFVSEYNKENKDRLFPSPRARIKDAVCGVIMMIATALFLLFGFVWNWWHPAWIVFPIGGILCGVVSTILGTKENKG